MTKILDLYAICMPYVPLYVPHIIACECTCGTLAHKKPYLLKKRKVSSNYKSVGARARENRATHEIGEV